MTTQEALAALDRTERLIKAAREFIADSPGSTEVELCLASMFDADYLIAAGDRPGFERSKELSRVILSLAR